MDKPESLTTLSIVIPIYNEAGTWQELLRRVEKAQLPLQKQIILVDDCSTDGTADQLSLLQRQRPDLTVVFHQVNRGKGAALRT